MAFNPFKHVECRYGSPMGRHGDDVSTYDGVSKLYARHCRGDGYYDSGGAYWGHSKVCAVWTRGGKWRAYVECHTPETAIKFVKATAKGWELNATSKQWVRQNGDSTEFADSLDAAIAA